MKYTLVSTFSIAGCLAALSITSSFGVVTMLSHVDTVGHCDTLDVPAVVEELGENSDGGAGGPGPFPGPFSLDDYINVEFVSLGAPSCLATNGPGVDLVISITNLTSREFYGLWYVADPGTTITNFDGKVAQIPPGTDSLPAFRIDAVGVNTPLLSESILGNGIFEPGETWKFVLQDYSSVIAPDLIRSIGLGVNSPLPPADSPSSGSIVAGLDPDLVPEPSRALLVGMGLLAVLIRRRRRSN